MSSHRSGVAHGTLKFDSNNRLVIAISHAQGLHSQRIPDYVAVYDSDFTLLFKREAFSDFRLADSNSAMIMARLAYDTSGSTERIYMAGQAKNSASISTFTLPTGDSQSLISIEDESFAAHENGVPNRSLVTHLNHAANDAEPSQSYLVGALTSKIGSDSPQIGVWLARLNLEGMPNTAAKNTVSVAYLDFRQKDSLNWIVESLALPVDHSATREVHMLLRDATSDELVFTVFNQSTNTVVKAVELAHAQQISLHPTLLAQSGATSVFGRVRESTATSDESQIDRIAFMRLSSNEESSSEAGSQSDEGCFKERGLWADLTIESLHIAFMQQEALRFEVAVQGEPVATSAG